MLCPSRWSDAVKARDTGSADIIALRERKASGWKNSSAAERIGLIKRVVPADQLMATALTLAQRLATGPTQAMRSTKVSVNKSLRETANLVLDMSLALEKHCFATADHKEAIQAFVEKREPKFTGR